MQTAQALIGDDLQKQATSLATVPLLRYGDTSRRGQQHGGDESLLFQPQHHFPDLRIWELASWTRMSPQGEICGKKCRSSFSRIRRWLSLKKASIVPLIFVSRLDWL